MPLLTMEAFKLWQKRYGMYWSRHRLVRVCINGMSPVMDFEKMRPLGLIAFGALVLNLLPVIALADDGRAQDQSAGGAGEIVVTGRALAPALGDRAYDIVTVSRAQLQSVASDRLEDVLRDAGGLAQFRRSDARSAHPTSQGVTLRGLGGNASSRALVILDGVPLADPFGGWIAWPALSPRQFGAVRVTRGGGAGAHGAGALAGTIEIESAERDDLSTLDAGLAFGERNAWIADASGKLDVLGGYATLAGRVDKGDGFVPIVAGQRGAVDRAAPYEQWSLRGRVVLPVAADLELQVGLSASGDERERGTAFSASKSESTDASVRLISRGAWAWEALGFVQRRGFESDFAAVSADRSSVTQSLDQFDTPADGYGLKFEVRPPVGEGAELRVGLDYRKVDGETNERFTFINGSATRLRRAGGENETVGVFGEYSASVGDRLVLTGGARLDHWRIADGVLVERTLATGAALRNDLGADRDDVQWLGRVGAAYQVTPLVGLRAAVYQSYRLPTLNELYRPFRAGADATAANLTLEPETLKGAEVGAQLELTPALRVGATAFFNVLDDAIANVTVAKLPGNICVGVGVVAGACRQRQNLQSIDAAGIELNAQYKQGPWTLGASYSFVDATVSANGLGAALDGLRPAQTPQHQVSARAEWASRSGARVGVGGRYLSGQFEDDQNLRRLDSATVLDGFVSVPVSNGLVFELRGENLTDTLVEAGVSATGVVERASPRTIWLAVRYRR